MVYVLMIVSANQCPRCDYFQVPQSLCPTVDIIVALLNILIAHAGKTESRPDKTQPPREQHGSEPSCESPYHP